MPGFPIKPSVSLWSEIFSCSPSTSFAYSSCNLATSVVLILQRIVKPNRRKRPENNALFNLLRKFGDTTTCCVQHGSCEVYTEGFDADIVWCWLCQHIAFKMTVLNTDIVCLIKYHYRIFWHFLGNLLCYFGIKQIMERVYDDVNKGHLVPRSELH